MRCTASIYTGGVEGCSRERFFDRVSRTTSLRSLLNLVAPMRDRCNPSLWKELYLSLEIVPGVEELNVKLSAKSLQVVVEAEGLAKKVALHPRPW